MYDYVVVLLVDSIVEEKVYFYRKKLEKFGIQCTEKLPPHVTIDLYKHIQEEKLLDTIAYLLNQIESFSFTIETIGDFDNSVFFLQPNTLEQFMFIKRIFDENLSFYAIKDNKNKGLYHPHITIVSGKDIAKAQTILTQNFTPFQGNITDICVYNKQKQLIKKYNLNKR